jgi:hypothetical protein
MTQPYLFEIEAPSRAACPRSARQGAAVAEVGEVAAGSPKPRRKAKRAKPQAPTNPQPTVERGPGWWRLTFPAPDKLMSVNTGKHWRQTGPVKKAWREAMFTYAGMAHLPKGLSRIRVDIELRFPTRGERDASNYHHYCGKPTVDALGRARLYQIQKGKRAGEWVNEPGYGLIPDDNPKKFLHCEDCPHLRVSDELGAKPFGTAVVTITDLSAEVAA